MVNQEKRHFVNSYDAYHASALWGLVYYYLVHSNTVLSAVSHHGTLLFGKQDCLKAPLRRFGAIQLNKDGSGESLATTEAYIGPDRCSRVAERLWQTDRGKVLEVYAPGTQNWDAEIDAWVPGGVRALEMMLWRWVLETTLGGLWKLGRD